MQRDVTSSKLIFGGSMPLFSLSATDGKTITNTYFQGAPFSLVVFSCNHCPYVVGSEKMLMDTIREFQEKGLKAVLISSNDPTQYPEDSFDKMKEKATRDLLPCPYLFDETQETARAFDAQCTPECYLFDASLKLVFHGTINNSPRHPGEVKTNFLNTALTQILTGEAPDPQFVHPIGCSIKWR